MRTLGVGFVHKKGVGALGVEFLPGVPPVSYTHLTLSRS